MRTHIFSVHVGCLGIVAGFGVIAGAVYFIGGKQALEGLGVFLAVLFGAWLIIGGMVSLSER